MDPGNERGPGNEVGAGKLNSSPTLEIKL